MFTRRFLAIVLVLGFFERRVGLFESRRTQPAAAYGLSPEQLEARAADLCPIERIDVAARAGVPFWIIHGDADKVVPLEPNSAELKKRYEAAGKGNLVTLIIAPGQGHSFWEGFFHCQPLVDFLIARAKAEPLDSE